MPVANFSSIARAVVRCLSRRREIQAAYIFGSVARGRARPDSDIDVAVLVSPQARGVDPLAYRLGLMAELGSALRRPDVEVVVLNDAPPLLAHRVLSQGRLVYERSASTRIRFQVQTANRYADLIPLYETHIRYLKKQVGKQRKSRPRSTRPAQARKARGRRVGG